MPIHIVATAHVPKIFVQSGTIVSNSLHFQQSYKKVDG